MDTRVLDQLWRSLRVLLPPFGFLMAVYAVKGAWYLWRHVQLARAGMPEVDAMDGLEFEEYLQTLFERLGYSVQLTSVMGDWGADLVLRRHGVGTVVQAKRWRRKVGVKAVQEALAAMPMYRCTHAMVVTNSRFTEQAQVLASRNGVELWDRDRLVREALAVRRPGDRLIDPATEAPDGQARVPDAPNLRPTAPDPTRRRLMVPGPLTDFGRDVAVPASPPETEPRCAACGRPVTERVAAYCREHAQRFGGRIYCYHDQRGQSARPGPSGDRSER